MVRTSRGIIQPMKISNVESYLLRLPYGDASAPRQGPTNWPTLDYVLLRIDTEEGISGWGDAFAYGVPLATKAALDHTIAPLLLGRDAAQIAALSYFLQHSNHLWGRYGVTLFAISGVDIALWDIAGKAAGLPLHRLLGGARREQIPAYASLFRYGDAERVAARTRQALDDGFTHIKLHEIRESEVRAARDACGDGVPLMVDTNCPWTPLQAREMAQRFQSYDLHWLEEPLFPPEDFASLARLQREVGIPLAAGENACTAFEFQKMIAADAVTYLQPSVTKVGGISEFRKVLALAEAHGRAVAPHTPYFGPGLLASLHLLATMGDDSLVEILCVDGLEATPYGEATATRDGMLQVPQAPGLGIDPDPDVLKDYAA